MLFVSFLFSLFPSFFSLRFRFATIRGLLSHVWIHRNSAFQSGNQNSVHDKRSQHKQAKCSKIDERPDGLPKELIGERAVLLSPRFPQFSLFPSRGIQARMMVLSFMSLLVTS